MTTYALSNGGLRNPVFYVTPDGRKLTTQDDVRTYLSKHKKTKDWKEKQNLKTDFLFIPIGINLEYIGTSNIRKKCPYSRVVELDTVFAKFRKVYSFRLHLERNKYIMVDLELPVDPSFFDEYKEKQTEKSYVVTYGVWNLSRESTLKFCLPVPNVRTICAIDVCQEDVDLLSLHMPSKPFQGKDFQLMVETQTDYSYERKITAIRYSLTWLKSPIFHVSE